MLQSKFMTTIWSILRRAWIKLPQQNEYILKERFEGILTYFSQCNKFLVNEIWTIKLFLLNIFMIYLRLPMLTYSKNPRKNFRGTLQRWFKWLHCRTFAFSWSIQYQNFWSLFRFCKICTHLPFKCWLFFASIFRCNYFDSSLCHCRLWEVI